MIGEEQKISVYDALKAVTLQAAYEYFEEDIKGSIEVRKHADLVVLDRSPLDVIPMEIKDIQVVMTIKDGEVIYQQKATDGLKRHVNEKLEKGVLKS